MSDKIATFTHIQELENLLKLKITAYNRVLAGQTWYATVMTITHTTNLEQLSSMYNEITQLMIEIEKTKEELRVAIMTPTASPITPTSAQAVVVKAIESHDITILERTLIRLTKDYEMDLKNSTRIVYDKTHFNHLNLLSSEDIAVVSSRRLLDEAREKLKIAMESYNPVISTQSASSSPTVKQCESSMVNIPFTVKEVRLINEILSDGDVKQRFNGCLNIMWRCAWRAHYRQKKFNLIRFNIELANAKDTVVGVGGLERWENLFENLVANNNWDGIIDRLTKRYAVFNLIEPTLEFLDAIKA